MSLEYDMDWLKTEPPSILYHYTSAPGLLGIIESRELWLSDCAYLNDEFELKHADQHLENIIARLKRDANLNAEADACLTEIQDWLSGSHFVCPLTMSLSEAGDLLSQWRGYCPKSGGFSIGFRSDFHRSTNAPFSFTLRPCIYDDNRQNKILSDIVEFWITKTVGKPSFSSFELFYRVIRPILKHRSFEEEKEWRLLSMDDQTLFEGIQYRASGNLIVPYFPIKFSGHELPIKEVIVGPCTNPKLSAASVERYLKSKGLTEVSMRVSDSSLRTN